MIFSQGLHKVLLGTKHKMHSPEIGRWLSGEECWLGKHEVPSSNP